LFESNFTKNTRKVSPNKSVGLHSWYDGQNYFEVTLSDSLQGKMQPIVIFLYCSEQYERFISFLLCSFYCKLSVSASLGLV